MVAVQETLPEALKCYHLKSRYWRYYTWRKREYRVIDLVTVNGWLLKASVDVSIKLTEKTFLALSLDLMYLLDVYKQVVPQ